MIFQLFEFGGFCVCHLPDFSVSWSLWAPNPEEPSEHRHHHRRPGREVSLGLVFSWCISGIGSRRSYLELSAAIWRYLQLWFLMAPFFGSSYFPFSSFWLPWGLLRRSYLELSELSATAWSYPQLPGGIQSYLELLAATCSVMCGRL